MPRAMWQALAGYLGSNTTASPGEEGKTIFIAETNDWGLLKEAFARVVPLGRFGDADEIAKAVAFLASDEARYASRIELFVDGDVAQV